MLVVSWRSHFPTNEPAVIRQSFMMKTALRTFFFVIQNEIFFFNVNGYNRKPKKNKKQKQKTKSSIITISLSFDVSFKVSFICVFIQLSTRFT